MTSETAKPALHGSLLDRLAIVVGSLCAIPLVGALLSVMTQRSLQALMLLIVAAPLLIIWLLLAFLMKIYRRPPSRWVMISAAPPVVLALILLAFGGLVLAKLVQS